jgi:cell division protein FtsZ
MKQKEMEAVKEVVDRMQATYGNLGEPVTLVIGCGGAGNNFVDYFHGLDVEGITTIGINTDEQHLTQIEADKKVFIGKTITRGRGAGGHKEIGERAAEIAEDILKDIVNNSDIVFLVAGLGGGTGLGATPVIGRLAKEQGAVVIGIGILPFTAEVCRRKKADKGSAELKKIAESTILLDNNKLLKIAPGLSAEEGLNIMNRMISQVIISTRNTMVQTISATEGLDVSDLLGEVRTGAIEEKKPKIDAASNIVLPTPLHANTIPDTMGNTPGNNTIENHIVDNIQ